MSMSPGGDRHAAQIFGFDTEEEAQTKAFDKMNPGLIEARGKLLSKASALSDRAYQGYDGQRVADLSQNENLAMSQARTGYDQGREYANLGARQIDDVANNDFSGENIQKYMNPYIDGVVNKSIKNANLAAAENQNNLKATAAQRGAFGGSRQSLLESQAEKNRLDTIGDITTAGNAAAYDKAIQGWQGDNERKLGAAKAYADVGNDITRMNSQQISDLMATGGADRALKQLNLDVDYSKFIEKRDWDVNNLDVLMKAVSSVGGGTNVSGGGANSQNRASNTGQVLGAISAIAGYFGKNSGGSSGGGYDGSGSGIGDGNDFENGGGMRED